MTNKKRTLLMYVSFIFVFTILVLIATRGSAPYNSNAIEVGNFKVAWYAVFILSGVVFAFIMGLNEFRKFNLNPDILYDGIIIALPLAIVGARLHYILFNLSQVSSIGDIFNIQNGGLGIHGAVIVTFLFLIYFAKRKKISYWFIMEIVVVGFFIGQMIGRWGNFMNQELYGPVVDNLNWLPSIIRDHMFINGSFRHPVFLYESISNLLGVILLLNVVRRFKFYKLGDGLAFYLVWYGIVRIPVELLRIGSGVDEPLKMFGIYVSVWISVLFIIGGGVLFIVKRKLFKNLPHYNDYSNKAILLDLDGTVVDTADLIIKTFKEVFKTKLPKIKLTEKDYLEFIGPTLVESFSKYASSEEEVSELVKTYVEISERNHNEEEIKTFSGVEDTIKWFVQNNYQIAVVSSKNSRFVKLGLEKTNLLQYINLIIGSDNVDEHKPSPKPLLEAVKVLGIDATQTFYVGDHENDIKSAKAADIKSVLVGYSIRYHEALNEKPDFIINNFEDLLLVVKNNL